jgi:hypothetical protein
MKKELSGDAKRRVRYLIIFGLLGFAAANGALILLSWLDFPSYETAFLLWIALFSFEAFIVARFKPVPMSGFFYLRALIALVIAIAIINLSPWNAFIELAAYSADTVGFVLVLWLMFSIIVLCAAGGTFIVIGLTTLQIPQSPFLFIVRFLVVVAALAIILLIVSNLLMSLVSSIPEVYRWPFGFVDVFLTHVVYLPAHYYVVNGYLGETRSLWPRTQTDAQRD